MNSKDTEFDTEDLALASYLKMKGVPLVSYETGNGNGKVVFTFEDEEENCKKLHIEFLNSECKKFDSEVRDLKKLLRR